MRVLIWNINALAPTVRNFAHAHGGLKGFLCHHEVDIACFQETKLPSFDKLTRDLACVPDYESFWAVSREKKGYSGTVNYVQDDWSPIAAEVDCLGSGDEDIDREGRIVLTDHGPFVLINVYAPNAGPAPERPRAAYKCKFLQALHSKALQLRDAGRQVLIVGDLNMAASQQDVHAKLQREAMYSSHEKELFAAMLADFTDIWRLHHPTTTNSFTVWDEKTNARAFNEGVRIDYALCSPGLLPHVVSCEILSLPPKWSDHAAIILACRAEGLGGPRQTPPLRFILGAHAKIQ
ncbi:minichromosome maintenance- protein, variant 2 [Trebouxia sp. C0010 RCD-2024]